MAWVRGPTIGCGSTAKVSLATSLLSGDIFAVKSSEISNSLPLQTEQSFLSTLASEFIVQCKGHEITNENGVEVYNLCLEYVSGGTLRDEIRRQGGRLDENKIRSFTRDLLQGLKYLHGEAEIAHCDIKCQNILLTSEKRTKIADFGCSRSVGKNSSPPTFSGSPAFMAPEVARWENQDCAADIWSLGCTIIEMATGKTPWEEEADDPVTVLYRVGFSGDVPEIPAGLSQAGKDFLSKCFRRNPIERWTARELLDHPFASNIECKFDLNVKDLAMKSPSCVLDYGFWRSVETQETLLEDQRLSQLIGHNTLSVLEISIWDSDNEWIIVRNREEQVSS